jgi:hypothetical protein
MRHLITWEELMDMPILDGNSLELPIYCDQGFIIQRCISSFSKNTPAHGMLLNLTTVKELFEPTVYENEGLDWDNNEQLPNTYVYPQAGLKTADHYQANRIMLPFKRFIRAVNNSLHHNNHSDNGNDSLERSRRIINRIASQGYNSVIHSTWGHSAQHHNAQLRIITGALAGSWAQGESAKHIANEHQEKCAHQLPHKAFEEKIKNRTITHDLCLENVYYVDLKHMDDNDQNGQYAFLRALLVHLSLSTNYTSTELSCRRLSIL